MNFSFDKNNCICIKNRLSGNISKKDAESKKLTLQYCSRNSDTLLQFANEKLLCVSWVTAWGVCLETLCCGCNLSAASSRSLPVTSSLLIACCESSFILCLLSRQLCVFLDFWERAADLWWHSLQQKRTFNLVKDGCTNLH